MSAKTKFYLPYLLVGGSQIVAIVACAAERNLAGALGFTAAVVTWLGMPWMVRRWHETGFHRGFAAGLRARGALVEAALSDDPAALAAARLKYHAPAAEPWESGRDL